MATMRKISELRNLPVCQLSDEEIVKAARDRLDAKAVIFIYMDQQDQAWSFCRWASTKQGGAIGRKFISCFKNEFDNWFKYKDWKLPF